MFKAIRRVTDAIGVVEESRRLHSQLFAASTSVLGGGGGTCNRAPAKTTIRCPLSYTTKTSNIPIANINMVDIGSSSATSNKKVCFVTTGATAPFTGLIESVLQSSSIDALRAGGYTHLLIQYGSAKHIMNEHAKIAVQRLEEEHGNSTLDIDGFDFNQDGLKSYFKLVQDSKGLVISHAGMPA